MEVLAQSFARRSCYRRRVVERSALRRLIERVALASLPLVGACGAPRGMSAAEDMHVAAGGGGGGDGGAPVCPPSSDCIYLVYVDGGAPTDNIVYWDPDGGAPDPCGPCRFEAIPGLWCGQCQVVHNVCGTAYFCSTFDCSAACDAV